MLTKSYDISPGPTHVITVPVAKLEPQWLRIYVGGDDDADACARTRAHAHADAVDDADADAGAYAHACAYAYAHADAYGMDGGGGGHYQAPISPLPSDYQAHPGHCQAITKLPLTFTKASPITP